MKRKLLFLCFCEGFGIVCAWYLKMDVRLLRYLCAAAFLCAAGLIFTEIRSRRSQGSGLHGSAPGTAGAVWRGNRWQPALALGLVMLGVGGLHMGELESHEFASAALEGQIFYGSGSVSKCEVRQGYSLLTVRCAELGETILVRFESDDLEKAYSCVGCSVSFSGKAELPRERRNPGCFDYRLYLKTRGIRSIVRVNPYRLEAGGVENRALHWLSVSKYRFLERLKQSLDEDRFSVLAALVFGEKSYLDEGIYEDFRNNGTAHVLAVSGIHVGLLYAAVQALLGGRKNYVTSGITILLLLAYAALANFSISVLRAACMIFLHIMSFHLERRYDMVSAASLTAIIFMTANPFTVFDSGFQLSFAAAYAMGVALPWVQLKITKLSDDAKSNALYHAANVMAPALMIQMAMAPLLAFHFLSFSVIAPLVNPLAVAIAGLLLPAGMGAFVLCGFSGLLNRLCGLGAGVLLSLNEAASSLDFSHFSVPAPPLGLLILYYCCFFFFFSETRYMLHRKRLHKVAAAVFVFLLALSCSLPKALDLSDSLLPWEYSKNPVVFVDVGQGDCIHIRAGRKNILLDGGGSYYSNVGKATLRDYLLKNGITHIDLAIVSHMDMDHYKGLAELSELMRVDEFAFPETCRGDPLLGMFKCDNKSFLKAGDRLELGKGCAMDILYPLGSAVSSESNENSLVALLTLERRSNRFSIASLLRQDRGGASSASSGGTAPLSILLTADMTAAMEADCLLRYPDLRADILKVAHHGSAYSTTEEFTAMVSPRFAVISCGRNNSFGHPAPRVIDLLSESGIIYGRTDLDGAITVKALSDAPVRLRNAPLTRDWRLEDK